MTWSIYDVLNPSGADAADSVFGTYDDTIDTTSTAIGDAADTITADAAAALERLKTVSVAFMSAYYNFAALNPDPSDPMYPQWADIKGRADIAQSTLQRIADAAQSTLGWAKSVFGLAGVRRGMGALGIAPVLAYAFIAGAIALVVAITNEMLQFYGNYQLRLQGKPCLPGTTGCGGKGTIQSATDALITVAIIAGAVLLLPKILDYAGARR